MLPEKVQESVRIAQEMTKNNDRCTAPGPSSFSRSDNVFFLKVHPEPLYALHIKRRDSYGSTFCCAGKGGERPGRYTTSVRALPACHRSLTFTVVCTRITEEDIERYMMTNLAGSPPLDILVRSSGVKRLSDFLMWQVLCPTTCIDRLVSLTGCFSTGVRERAASFHSYVLAGYWILGSFPCYFGLSGQGVESATAAGGLSDRGVGGAEMPR